MSVQQARRERFEEHYNSGQTPWDTRQTPPEVQRFWMSGRLAREGTALDLGCGPGTNVTYLARLGLTAVGVDYLLQPLALARKRLDECARAEPAMVRRVHLLLGDVTRLPVAGLNACYVLDVGCLHGIPPEERDGYVAGVLANLAPGGYYQLYAFDRTAEPDSETERIRGMLANEVAERFAPALEVVEIERARPDRHPCRWYLLRRRR